MLQSLAMIAQDTYCKVRYPRLWRELTSPYVAPRREVDGNV